MTPTRRSAMSTRDKQRAAARRQVQQAHERATARRQVQQAHERATARRQLPRLSRRVVAGMLLTPAAVLSLTAASLTAAAAYECHQLSNVTDQYQPHPAPPLPAGH